jgi:hypothetical protein
MSMLFDRYFPNTVITVDLTFYKKYTPVTLSILVQNEQQQSITHSFRRTWSLVTMAYNPEVIYVRTDETTGDETVSSRRFDHVGAVWEGLE